jgi:hypothetical protein
MDTLRLANLDQMISGFEPPQHHGQERHKPSQQGPVRGIPDPKPDDYRTVGTTPVPIHEVFILGDNAALCFSA